MKRQARLNAEKAYRTAILLETSQKLQKAEGSQAILALTAHQLNKLLDRDLVIYQREENGELSPTLFPVSPETSCQGLFNQIHKKATKKVPEALSCS